jgi:hypothetical protein
MRADQENRVRKQDCVWLYIPYDVVSLGMYKCEESSLIRRSSSPL